MDHTPRSFSLKTSPFMGDSDITFYQPIASGDGSILTTGCHSQLINQQSYKQRSVPTNGQITRSGTIILAGLARSRSQSRKISPNMESISSLKRSNTKPTLKQNQQHNHSITKLKVQKSVGDFSALIERPEPFKKTSKKPLIAYEDKPSCPSPKIDPYQIARQEMQKKLKQKKALRDQMLVNNVSIGRTEKQHINTRIKRAGPLVFSICFNDDSTIFDHTDLKADKRSHDDTPLSDVDKELVDTFTFET